MSSTVDLTTGRVLMVDPLAAVPPYSFNAAVKFDAQGRAVVSTTEPIVVTANGLGFTATGALAVTIDTP